MAQITWPSANTLGTPTSQQVLHCYITFMASAALTVSRASDTQGTLCHIKFTAYFRTVGPMFTTPSPDYQETVIIKVRNDLGNALLGRYV